MYVWWYRTAIIEKTLYQPWDPGAPKLFYHLAKFLSEGLLADS